MDAAIKPPFENKLVVIVNGQIAPGLAMMAISHAMLGFGAGVTDGKEVRLNEYLDADGNAHRNISEMPIVVLKADSGQIRALRKSAIERGIRHVDFCETMSIGTYEEEYALTKTKREEELIYWALVLFGPWNTVKEMTRKPQLYH
jgi:hypothetical protein